MTIRLTSDGKALVNTEIKYIKIDPKNPPKGKVVLINKWQRSPVIGQYVESHGFTHYSPLATFDETEE